MKGGLVTGAERHGFSQFGDVDAALLVTPRQRSHGRAALLRALKHVTRLAVAVRCRVSQQAVSSWAAGRSAPKASHRQRLEQIYGIPSLSWKDQQQ